MGIAMHQSKAETFLLHWTELVGRRDVEGVLALYAEDAVLVPTFSNRLLTTPERIREYFVTLCSRDRLGLALHTRPRVLTSVSEHVGALGGIYRWQFAVD